MRPRSPLRKAMEGTLFRKIEQAPSDDRKKAERKLHYTECREAIDFCLNCWRKTCSGNCTELKRFKRENNLHGKYVRDTNLAGYTPRKNVKRYPYKGQMLTIRQLASMADVCLDAMYKRIVKRGMSPEEAVAMGNSHPGYRTRRTGE